MLIGRSLAPRLALWVGLAVFAAAPSQAIQMTLDVAVGGVLVGTLDQDDLGCGAGDITNCFTDVPIDMGSLRISRVDLFLDSDPVVSGEIAVENLLNGLQQYTLTVTLITGPIGPLTLTGGSVAGGVTDGDGNTATVSSLPGGAIYTALLDGASYQTLFPHLTSATVLNPFESADILPEGAFGTPIPSQPGPAVVNSIGLRYDFTLTGRDLASFTGVFVVNPVPEPGTGLLLGLGLALIAARRRR